MDYLKQIDDLWSRGFKCPVETLEDLDRLDEGDILKGYLEFDIDDPEPGNNHSRAYWHGWCNAATDRGFRPIISAQHELARLIIERDRRRRIPQ